MQNPIVLVVGTRPDAIKLAPVYKQLKKANLPVFLCSTHQHRELINQALNLFNISADVSLDVMRDNQSLEYVTTTVVERATRLFREQKPSLVLVQGDTTSAYAAALAAFYNHIPVGHIEAGLRTGNMESPFPEEANRVFITKISSLHFAPTPLSVLHLLHDGVPSNKVFCVGNTVVDAQLFVRQAVVSEKIKVSLTLKNLVHEQEQNYKRMVLLTAHRRESFGQGIENIIKAIKDYALKNPDLFVFFPVHPNPHIRDVVYASYIHELANVFCCDPLSYADLMYILMHVDCVITDSGGIQEEAVSFGKRVIILRDFTERIEVVWEGKGKLVGTNVQAIIKALDEWHDSAQNQNKTQFIYGDGNTSERIVAIIKNRMSHLRIMPAQVLKEDPVAFDCQQSYADIIK